MMRGGGERRLLLMELPQRLGRWSTREDLAYFSLLFLGALDAAGYSLIAPVLPAIARELHAGPALVGVLVASFPAAMIGGFALAGRGVKQRRIPLVLRISLLLAGIRSL